MSVCVPDFRVTLDGNDLTSKMRPRLVSIRLTEKRGGEADQLDITLDDSDGRLAIPSEGAKLKIELGWKAGSEVTIGLVNKGMFVVDDVNHSGPPDQLTIRASSADFNAGLSTRREKSWHNSTIGAIVRDIAARHKLKAKCAASLAGVAVKSLSQSRESDLALLRRLGREHDAVATIKSGTLLFAPIGSGQTASGKALPAVTIERRAGDRHDYRVEKREAAGKVTASWHDRKGAAKKTVSTGSGEPEKHLARVYGSEKAAREATKAEQKRGARAPKKLDLTLALARLDIFPEQKASVAGIKQAIDATKWLIAEVSHELTDRGFATHLQMETSV